MAVATVLRLRLVPVAACAWTTAGASCFLPDSAATLAAVAWSATFIALAVVATTIARQPRPSSHRRPHRLAWPLILILCCAAAAAVATHVAFAQSTRTEVQGLALDGGRATVVSATVTGKIERRASGEIVFDAMATRISTGTVTDAVRVEVSVRVRPADVDDLASLDVGATVEASGTARAGFPGDRAVLTVIASRGVRVIEPAGGLLAAAASLRRGLVAATVGLPAPGAGLIPGLAVGDTSIVSEDLDADMKTSSLSHLTAVSGANCALVVGLAFAAAAAVGASRRVRVVVGVAALGGFVLLVTPEPSVVRAAAMATIAMLGVLLGRVGVGMSVLCLAVTVLLLTDPWLAGSLGFALSSVATASLLLFARPIADGLARWMPRALALALSVPIAAQLACGPLLVLITPTVPLYGVLANLLAAPAAPVATIVGLAACLAAPLPWLQSGLTAISWVPAAWIAGTATTFSGLPGGTIAWLADLPGAVLLAVVGCAIGILIGVPKSPSRAAVRAVSGVVVALVIGVLAGNAALGSFAGRLTLPAEWSVLACDVGQGDAVLVRSGGAVALIDTGPDAALLSTCLTRTGIDRIDLLVLTHFDLDHVGGAAAVTGRVTTVLHGPPAGAADEIILRTLMAAGADAAPAHAGMTGSLGEARWTVIWPPAQSRAFPSGNDASVVVDIRGGGVPASLFLGDLSASPQRALEASGDLRPPYDLVKVAHHGSADQYPGLYSLAAPAVALLTVGADNDYGHPRAETIAFLEESGAAIARTDREGAIALWQTQQGISLWRERAVTPTPTGDSVSGALGRLDQWPRARDGHRRRRARRFRSSPGAHPNPHRSC